MPSLPTMLKCVVPALEDHTSAQGQELDMHDVQHRVSIGIGLMPIMPVTAEEAMPYHDHLAALAARSSDLHSSLAAVSRRQECQPCVSHKWHDSRQFIATYPDNPTLTCMNMKVAMCTLHTTALLSGIPQAVSKLARQCVVQQRVLLAGVDKGIGRVWARVPQAHPQRKCVLHGLRPQQQQDDGRISAVWAFGNATC
jgi:hypothetical protein